MNASDNHNITELNKYLREEIPKIKASLDKMDRAIYGDVDNNVPGLIDYNKQTQNEIQKIEARFESNLKDVKNRISGLETIKNKIKWIIAGMVGGASVGGASLWELITRMK